MARSPARQTVWVSEGFLRWSLLDIMFKGRTRCPAVGRCLLLPQKVQFARPVKVETILSQALEGLLGSGVLAARFASFTGESTVGIGTVLGTSFSRKP